MNRVSGMTLDQFYKTVEEMRTLYPFKNETTRISNMQDLITDSQRHVEIVTTDEKTGVIIVMHKEVKLDVRGNN